MYLNGKQTGNLPCKPFQTSFNARLDFRFFISGSAMMNCATMPMNVEVGGATIFVIDVEDYEKI